MIQRQPLYRLIITLVIVWCLLSGMFSPLLLSLGVISIAVVCYFAINMQVLWHKGQPIYLRPFHLIRYWLWLIVEVFKSNWDVTKRVLNPSLPIQPTLKSIPAPQKTELGRVIYANSITLTPGTVAINITKNGDVLVHALHEDTIADLEKGVMSDRVCQLEPHLSDKEAVSEREQS